MLVNSLISCSDQLVRSSRQINDPLSFLQSSVSSFCFISLSSLLSSASPHPPLFRQVIHQQAHSTDHLSTPTLLPITCWKAICRHTAPGTRVLALWSLSSFQGLLLSPSLSSHPSSFTLLFSPPLPPSALHLPCPCHLTQLNKCQGVKTQINQSVARKGGVTLTRWINLTDT